jgi:hypothetical protein
MTMPGFAAESSLQRGVGRYVQKAVWGRQSGDRVSIQLSKGCGPCVGGTKVCCVGYDPETGEPICTERLCTEPPPPPPPIDCGANLNCGSHCCPPNQPCCRSGCCPVGTHCCDEFDGCCPNGTTCRSWFGYEFCSAL